MRYWIQAEDEDFERQREHELRRNEAVKPVSGGVRIAFYLLIGAQVSAAIAVVVLAVLPR
jgi:hypothetical protein